MTTKDEFSDLLMELVTCELDLDFHVRCGAYDAATTAARDRRDKAQKAVTGAFAEEFARILRLECEAISEVSEFNAGFDAYGKGIPVENEPPDTEYDQWRSGWAWGTFEPMRARIAELEAMLKRLEWGLFDNGGHAFCAWCGVYSPSHAPDCELATQLGG